jgi:ADP-ribosyl-[dinitrogen reductase] hydrolase
LWIGISPKSSGVFSAGNGPAMRAAIFGAALDDLDQIAAYVRTSTRITHSDPKAEYGAKAVALAAYFARREPEIQPIQFFERLTEWIGPEGEELCELIHMAAKSVTQNQSTTEFADEVGLGRGVSGYIYHTVPVVIHAWLSNRRDFHSAVTSVIECGGDADTTAAIVGGIVGTTVGESGIPSAWMETLCEWPGTVSWMRNLAIQLSRSITNSTTERPLKLNSIMVLFRNLFFLKVVLFHGFRRLLPPY